MHNDESQVCVQCARRQTKRTNRTTDRPHYTRNGKQSTSTHKNYKHTFIKTKKISIHTGTAYVYGSVDQQINKDRDRDSDKDRNEEEKRRKKNMYATHNATHVSTKTSDEATSLTLFRIRIRLGTYLCSGWCEYGCVCVYECTRICRF